MSTDPASDALALRLAVAKFMGLEVIGRAAYLKNPNTCRMEIWDSVYPNEPENESTSKYFHPVYVNECVCVDLGMANTGRILGHHRLCLSVVPDYVNDDAAAVGVLEKLAEQRATPSLCVIPGNGVLPWEVFEDRFSWEGRHLGSTFAEAVCRAAVADLVESIL